MNSALIIWQFVDGKPGHMNQSIGLINALRALTDLTVHKFPVHKYSSAVRRKLLERRAKRYGKPDLIIGTGHRTHSSILSAKWNYGGKAVVIMKPSLPMTFFDICLVPEHDNVKENNKVIPTQGALNKVTPSSEQNQKKGLFLIGGAAKAYSWDNQSILDQIGRIVEHHPDIDWTLTDSRRSPKNFASELTERFGDKLQFIPHTETDSNWVPRMLRQASRIWVSEDSTSMVYEALTAGGRVGLLEVPYRTKPGRVAKGIKTLQDSGALLKADQLADLHQDTTKLFRLNESQRCAELIYKKFFAKQVK